MDVSRKSFSAVIYLPARFTPTGFTLIEVLVALSIMTIGLLGLAALQLHGLRGAHEATLRTQAVALTTDVAERLHANALHASSKCLDTKCAIPALSGAEIGEWQSRVAQVLPQGEGRISTGASQTTVSVQWDAHAVAEQIDLSVTP